MSRKAECRVTACSTVFFKSFTKFWQPYTWDLTIPFIKWKTLEVRSFGWWFSGSCRERFYLHKGIVTDVFYWVDIVLLSFRRETRFERGSEMPRPSRLMSAAGMSSCQGEQDRFIKVRSLPAGIQRNCCQKVRGLYEGVGLKKWSESSMRWKKSCLYAIAKRRSVFALSSGRR